MKFDNNIEIDLGPLEPLFLDDTVSEIMVNGPEQIYFDREGHLLRATAQFDSEAHLMEIIHNILRPLGRQVNDRRPMVDARLPSGDQVTIAVRPVVLIGPTITLHKVARFRATWDDAKRYGSVDAQVIEFLKACVEARLNIVVAGGIGTGKTTTLNLLSAFFDANDRIITVEYNAALRLHCEHVVVMEVQLPAPDGAGGITATDLIMNAMKMRPDRLILGEARGGEVLHMFQAMNTGHDGSMFTMHATSVRDALARMEAMTTMAGAGMPVPMIREQMANAIDVIVYLKRFSDGTRKVTHISEIAGIRNNQFVVNDIFEFVQTDWQDGRVVGEFRPTGYRPSVLERMAHMGINFPSGFFEVE